MSRRLGLSITAAALVALGGCQAAKVLVPPNLRPAEDTAAVRKQAMETLKQATPCCSNLADFSYTQMLPWQPQRFRLGPGGLVANIDGTHSYFLAFRLPAGTKLPYRIAVKSELNGRWLHSSYLFAPTMIVLDSGFQPLEKKDLTLCEHMGWSNETTGAFGSLEVSKPHAEYLLVYSSAAQQAGSTYWEQSPATYSGNAASLQMGSTGSFQVPHGPDGTLWVGMMDKVYADAIAGAICKKPEKGDGALKDLNLRDMIPTLPWDKAKGATEGTASPSPAAAGSTGAA